MKRIATLFSLSLGLIFAGCAAEDAPPTDDGDEHTSSTDQLIDEDDEGQPDGVDLDGDGEIDFDLDELCDDPIVDEDGDGVPEALDLDCDGTPDICIVDQDGDGEPDGIDVACDGTVEDEEIIIIGGGDREEEF